MGEPSTAAGQKEIVLTRYLEAPRGRIFQQWTQSDQLAEWWGPSNFTNTLCRIDPRPDGLLRIDMRAPDGTVYPWAGKVREVVAPERLVFIIGPGREAGALSFELQCSATFVEQGEKTLLTVQLRVLNIFDPASAHYLEGLEAGWSQTLERLSQRMATLV